MAEKQALVIFFGDREGKKKLIGDVLEVYIQLKSELGESLV
jgi:hypothetical protein